MSATRGRWWRSRWLQAGVSLAVVALIFGFLFPKLADYREAWATIMAMTPLELITLGLVGLWNLISYWPTLTAALPGLRVPEAAVSNLASTSVANTLPGGAALGVGVTVTMQRSWGIAVGDIALAGVVSGIWNNLVKLGLPVIALACLALTGDAGTGLTTAAVIGVGVLVAAVIAFSLLLASDRRAARIGTLSERAVRPLAAPFGKRLGGGWDEAAKRFRAKTVGLLRARVVWITLVTVISHLSLYLVLLVALRNVGVSNDEVSWAKVLAAFSFVRLLSAIPVTPGGLGVVELGLTAAIGSGQADGAKNQIAAAVLLFRALTWFAPIPLGAVCWLFWHSNTSWRRSPEQRAVARVADV